MTVKDTFQIIEILDFLEWGELDITECVDVLGIDNTIKQVFISPDVFSLTIIWVEWNGTIMQETADWPDDDVNMRDFLSDEIGDDGDVIADGSSSNLLLNSIIPDFGGEVKKLKLSELG